MRVDIDRLKARASDAYEAARNFDDSEVDAAVQAALEAIDVLQLAADRAKVRQSLKFHEKSAAKYKAELADLDAIGSES